MFTAGEYQKSLDAFERALQLTRGTKADARAGAAMALERLGRPSAAEEALRQAIALNPLFANPPKLVESLLSNEEHAAVLQQINDRLTPPRP